MTTRVIYGLPFPVIVTETIGQDPITWGALLDIGEPTTAASISGVAGTGGVGSPTKSLAGTLLGVAGTGSLGTPTIGLSPTRDIPGNAATFSVGAEYDNPAGILIGASASFSIGHLARGGDRNINPDGVTASFDVGTIGETLTLTTIAGVGATSHAGELLGAHLIPGNSATFSVNTMTTLVITLRDVPSVSASFTVDYLGLEKTIPSVAGYFVAGLISDEGDVDVPHTNREVPPNSATLSTGTLAKRVSSRQTLSGNTIHSAIGRFPATARYTLTGHDITSAIGTIREVISAGGLHLDDLEVTQYPVVTLDTNVSLRWSDDRGETWRFPIHKSLGEGAEYMTSLQWRRLGLGRDRVFEISFSAPTETSITGIWYEIEDAQT